MEIRGELMSKIDRLSKEEYVRAENLYNDIYNLNKQITEIENGSWATIITRGTEDTRYYSDRFEKELIVWMRQKNKRVSKRI